MCKRNGKTDDLTLCFNKQRRVRISTVFNVAKQCTWPLNGKMPHTAILKKAVDDDVSFNDNQKLVQFLIRWIEQFFFFEGKQAHNGWTACEK